MPKITEARPVVVSEADSNGLFELQIISPGMGSSGLYPEKTLTEAVKNKVFAKGTQLFLDHPTQSEAFERPERSVRDLAGSLAEDARWSGGAIVAKARIYSTYRPLLAEAAPDIGMSIRADGEVSEGTHDGRRVRVIEALTECASVDFVTRPGRGGAVLSVLESARFSETTANDRREQLQQAVAAAHGDDDEDGRPWVRDYDEDKNLVYFGSYKDERYYQQSFTVTDDDRSVTLTGEPVEVRISTTYVPVSSAGQSTTTESTQELIMPQIEEARLRELNEAAGRVPTLEAERDQAAERARKAEEALAARDLRESAIARARDAVKDLHPAMADRVIESVTRDVPTREGRLDELVFDQAVTKAVEAEQAYARQFAPAGVTGFGQSGPVTESAARPRTNAWGREINKEA